MVDDLSLYHSVPLGLNPGELSFLKPKVHRDVYLNKTTNLPAIKYATLLKSERLHSVFVFNGNFSFQVNKTEKKCH